MQRVHLIIFFILISISSEGQRMLKLGVKAGLNLADIAVINYVNPDAESLFSMKGSLHTGLFATAALTGKSFIGSDLLYSNHGMSSNGRLDLHYIVLPLTYQYLVAEKLSVEVGPQFGYLFLVKTKYGDASNVWNNKLDIGMAVGGGYAVNDRLNINLRFYAGFSSVINSIDDSGTNFFPNGESIRYQNRVVMLSIAYSVLNREIF